MPTIPDKFTTPTGSILERSKITDLPFFRNREGSAALREWRAWRRENPGKPVIDFVQPVLKRLSGKPFSRYNETLLNPFRIDELRDDERAQKDACSLDVAIVGTGFGQLVDEGKIDPDLIPVVRIAVKRQRMINIATFPPDGTEVGADFQAFEHILQQLGQK